MNEADAREVLGEMIQPDGGLEADGPQYVYWLPGDVEATLDGEFGPQQLEAIAWWIGNR